MQNAVCTSKHALWWRHTAPGLLAASWGLGILLGYFVASSVSQTLVELVPQTTCQIMSMTGCLSVTVLPFFLTAFVVTFSEPCLLLFISTCKAFSFSFCAWGVCLAYGQCGWLVLFLFLFSDFLLIPLQYFYWLRHIRGDRAPESWELPILLGAAILVGYVDYHFVAPFLASLMI